VVSASGRKITLRGSVNGPPNNSLQDSVYREALLIQGFYSQLVFVNWIGAALVACQRPRHLNSGWMSMTVESHVLEKWIWSHNDYDLMGWHDATVHAIALVPEQWELILDIDYILPWLEPVPPNEYFHFWIARCMTSTATKS
jgi:hypothetical protein